eukprot:gene16938-29446_t
MTIVIPTSQQYTESFNATAKTAGLVMGWFMARYRLKTCILVMCSFSILGSALYALAQLSGHFSLVLIGRLVQGLGISPAVVTTYMARATPPGPLRANGMRLFSRSVSIGFGLGPGLGVLAELAAKHTNCTYVTFNSNTLPAWAMAVVWGLYMVAFCIWFVEPPGGSSGTGSSGGSSARTTEEAVRLNELTTFGSIEGSLVDDGLGVELVMTFRAENMWGWSIEHTALYLSGINFTAAFLDALKLDSKFTKGNVMQSLLLGFVLLVLPYGLFMRGAHAEIIAEVVTFAFGALVLLAGCNVARGSIVAICSQLAPPSHIPVVMSCVSVAIGLGRGIGSALGPHVAPGQNYGYFVLLLNGSALVAAASGYTAGWFKVET